MAPVAPFHADLAWAQEGGGNGAGGNGGGAGGGNAGGGNAGGHEDGGDHEDGGGHEGGGENAGGDNGGGQPAWSQEGIPEVELGRLNVARSPDRVLDQALAEALANLTPEMISFLNLTYDEMIEQLTNNWDNISIIDSPLENLALLQELLDGNNVLSNYGVTTSFDTLAALLLGVASDKTVEITADTVIAVTTILGSPITGAEAEELAAAADAMRTAVLTGHDG